MMLKYLLTFLLCFPAFSIFAQSAYDKINKNPFKQTQWYVGVRGGANYTTVSPINRYNLIKPTNDLDRELYDKQYKTVDNIGSIYGLSALFQFEQVFVLGANISVNQIKFSYDQELPSGTNSIRFDHSHDFRYLDVPIFFRWMIRPVVSRLWNKTGRKPDVPGFIPFLQAGVNFSVLMDARKNVEKSIIQDGIETRDLSISENVNELLNPVTGGVFAGAGFRYRLGNIYLTAEANFRQGFSNVTDAGRRYTNENLMNNAYDVFDDKSFQSYEVLVGILVPLKYLSRKEFIPIEI